jgi:hypothetical protein
MRRAAEEQSAREQNARGKRYARHASNKTLLPGCADYEQSSMEQR